MSRVSEVKVGTASKPAGAFKVGVFNLFDEAERKSYEALRTEGADRSHGIEIEHVQQFTRIIERGVGSAERREELFVLVQYWQRAVPAAPSGGLEPARDWFLERDAVKG